MYEEYLKGALKFHRVVASPPIENTEEIQRLYEAGDTVGAQKLILVELEKENQEAGEHGN